MSGRAPRYAVVGGGVTGLTAAHALTELAPDAQLYVFEAKDRLGGKLRTASFHGTQIELGADSFLDRDGTASGLCRSIGLEPELISPAMFKGVVWDGRRRYGLPERSVMGVPTSVGSVARSDALGAAEKLRAASEVLRRAPLRGPDVSVGHLVREHFGRAVLDRFVDPLLAGTRAGDVDEISLAAALPQVDRAARAGGSVTRALSRESEAGPNGPRFLTPRGGMSALIDALARRLPEGSIHLRTGVERVIELEGVFNVTTSDGVEHPVDGVVITVPAPLAAPLVAALDGGVAQALGSFTHASVAVIALAFPEGTLPDDGSSGFLVPSKSDLSVSAGTWWTRKWPHTKAEGVDVARVFVGRAERHPALEQRDDDLVATVSAELSTLLGRTVTPLDWSVTRWDAGLPQYRVGHLDRLARIEQALSKHPGIALAGADHRGSGIPDCIRQGREAARRVHEAVVARDGKVGA